MQKPNIKQLLSELRKEIKAENQMRVYVWKSFPSKKDELPKFAKQEHNRKFLLTTRLLKILNEMQPRELERIVNRIYRKIEENKNPNSELFQKPEA